MKWLARRRMGIQSTGPATERQISDSVVTDGYAEHWQPATLSDAMKLIVVNDDEGLFETTGREAAAPIVDLIGTQRGRVMDLGAGIGRIAIHVAEHCDELWLADLSPEMLTMARERLSSLRNLHFVQAQPTRVPGAPNDSFDLIYSVLVLQHLEREDAFCLMTDIARLLRPGGIAYLTFPNLLHPRYLESFIRYAQTGEVSNSARARFYTEPEVRCVVDAAGLEVLETDSSGADIYVTSRRSG